MSDSPARASRRRSWWVLGVIVGGGVLLVGVGWWSATLFQSSAQQEANAAAPSAAPVFSEVTRGTLTRELTFTGRVGPASERYIDLLPAADAALSVVTGHAVESGASVSSGGILTEVNGRPVFLATSAFPFYRDIGVGDHGPDVLALQSVLVTRGYDLRADGDFGSATARAVDRWYRDGGYEAPLRTRERTSDDRTADAADGTDPPGSAESGSPTEVAGARDPYVPVTEIVGIASPTAEVVRGIGVGAVVSASGTADVVLGSTEIIVTVSVSAAELGEVSEGDAATISYGGTDVQGTVGSIILPPAPGDTAESADPAQPGNSGAAADASGDGSFVVTPKAPLTPLPDSSQARVALRRQIVADEALLVPVLAITDRGGGSTVLAKRQDDGTLVEVPLTVLGTLNGQVAVEPDDPTALDAGDQVRVG